jgi:hypothetical protein
MQNPKTRLEKTHSKKSGRIVTIPKPTKAQISAKLAHPTQNHFSWLFSRRILPFISKDSD